MSSPLATTDDAARTALAEARSSALPGPDTRAGGAAEWISPARPLTAGATPDLDHVLRHALAALPGADGRLRPAPSAGALHPVNAHILAGRAGSLPAGRHAYDPLTHRAHPRGPAPADAPARTLVVLTVTARRTVSHYGHRALPLLLLDAGHAAAALARAGADEVCLDADGALLAAAAGLPDPAHSGRTWPGTEPQHPLAVLGIGPAAGRLDDDLRRWAACGLGPPPGARAGADDVTPVLARTRRALEELAANGAPAQAWTPAGVRLGRPPTSRRSAPPPLRGVPAPEELAHVLARAAEACPYGGPRWCVAVGGPRPALLELARDGDGAPLEHGRSPALRTLASGDARPALARWAAGQAWMAAAGAVLLAHGCPRDADAARIRRDHLAAGYATGLAQYAATELGVASRPVGSWQQADLGAALGGAHGRDWIVHGLVMGRDDHQ
ncbi:nitroreductase [Streptomyces sp. NPDC054887]